MGSKVTDTYRESLLRLYIDLSYFLNYLVQGGQAGRAQKDRSIIAESLFSGDRYQLTIQCRNNGIRPFLVQMDRPWKHSAYLGRLTRQGKVHLFDYGVKIFFDQLLEEGIFDPFARDLAGALDMHLGERPRDESRLDCDVRAATEHLLGDRAH